MMAQTNKKTQAIIPAAGSGVRMQADIAKPLLSLNGKPLIVYCLEMFERSEAIDSVILVGAESLLSDLKDVVKRHDLSKVVRFVVGGKTRSESVSNGLKALDTDTEFILIHDAVRPLISQEIIEEAIKACYRESAVVVAVPVKPTIKRVNADDLYVEATLDRRLLWEIQTPQVFKKDILLKAHQANAGAAVTDDATLVEMLGEKIKVIKGDYRNIKITTKEDICIAESLL